MNAQLNATATATAQKAELIAYTRIDSKGEFTGCWTSFFVEPSQKDLDAAMQRAVNEGILNPRFMSWDEYEAVTYQENLKRCNANVPSKISKEEFHERLNVLPPRRYFNNERFEGFMMSEEVEGSLYSFYLRFKGNDDAHFTVVARHDMKYSDFIAWCEAL